MVAKNDVTGDEMKTKTNSDLYRENYDRIFRKKQDEAKEFDEKVVMRDEYFDVNE
jgi:hypothetical protein